MGCDWIGPAGAAVGFKLSFDCVFKGSRFGHLDSIRSPDYYEEVESGDRDDSGEDEEDRGEEEDDRGEEEDDSGEEEDDRGEDEDESPHKFLANLWLKFISSKHAGLVDEMFTTFIGATSMPATYETQMFTHSCDVVFGYKMNLVTKEVDGVTELQSPVFSFPSGIKEAIVEFVQVYMKEDDDDDDDGKARVPAVKKAKLNEVVISKEPEIVYFVR